MHVDRYLGPDGRGRPIAATPREQFLRNIISPNATYIVAEAFARVNRVQFVPQEKWDEVYSDEIIKIEGATISQPSLVAKMMCMLEPTGEGKILEIGTASGVGAALLSHCAEEVHSIEVQPHLAEAAKNKLNNLRYKNVQVYVGDGLLGLSEQAPFKGIIATAAARCIPRILVDQLEDGGRIVMPVGPAHPQDAILMVGIKEGNSLITRPAGHVYFMPLMSGAEGGWSEDLLNEANTKRQIKFNEAAVIIAEQLGKPLLQIQEFIRSILKEQGYEKEVTDEQLNEMLATDPHAIIMEMTRQNSL